MLAQIDENTRVIPGHAPVAGYADLVAYVDMLKVLRARIATLVATGATLEDVTAAKATADYDAKLGNSTIFVDRAHASLTRALRGSHEGASAIHA